MKKISIVVTLSVLAAAFPVNADLQLSLNRTGFQASPSDLDPAFGTGGVTVNGVGPATEEINDLKIQSDGKIVAALWVETGTVTACGLVRYTESGALDQSFGNAGKVILDAGGGNQSFEPVAVQADGKIVAAGYISGPSRRYVIARFNPDGLPDDTFGTNGLIKGSFGTSTNDGIQALALQTDGKIVAVGNTRQSTVSQFVVARFLTDGSVDNAFGPGGYVNFGFANSGAGAEAVQIGTNGRITVAGSANNPTGIGLATLNPDGTLDDSFGTNGKVSTTGSGPVSDMGLRADGKIVVGNVINFGLTRYNADGSLDQTFGSNGTVQNLVGGISQELAVQQNGRIVVVGTDGGNVLKMVRFEQDGTLDAAFGSNGTVVMKVMSNTSNGIDAVALQQDGKIVIGGGTAPGPSGNWDLVIARYTGDPVQAAPTNVTVSGRILTPGGAGLRNAIVSVTDEDGVRKTAQTSTLGFFSFADLPAGQSYTIAVASRRYRYESRSMIFANDLNDLEFVGLE